MPERAIIHLNVADFAVAVERVVDPRLRGRPVVIAPEGAARAVVYDMSEEAYREGVRKGLPLGRALRRCRGAVVLPPHPDRYERAMRALLARALPYSPLVEVAGGDGHLFLDVTGTGRLHGPPADVAWRLRRESRAALGLDPIWSVAPSKLMAKVATRLVKPDGEYVIAAGEEASVLAPLPLPLLPGVEAEDWRRLRELRLARVGDLGRWSPLQLETILGARARHLLAAARGVDPSPVLPAGARPPVVAVDHELGDDSNERAHVEAVLWELAERAGAALRAQRLAAGRLALVLDHSDGVRAARCLAARPATAGTFRLFRLAARALDLAWTRRVRVRHLRLVADRLAFPPAQLELFAAGPAEPPAEAALVAALDRIRGRYGADAVRLGRALRLSPRAG
ncbi:MAG: hypothetical protein JW819_10100 [Candidatus Krumholzibacteriota bacterium]|nr:hypothetical protein [Candidatus Krumholzibacteriota bacterium]